MSDTKQGIALIALIIAGYAAIISTVTLIWNIIRGRRDRGELRIVLKLVKERPDLLRKESYFLYITMSNTGKRPISVVSLIIEYEKANEFVGNLDPYRRLEESESYTWHLPIKTDSAKWLGMARCIYTIDATGKRWRMGQADFSQFISEARSITHGENGTKRVQE